MKLEWHEVLEDLAAERLTNTASVESFVLDGVSTDSRQEVSGRLFVALRGEHYDANVFAADAVGAGAKACLIDRRAMAAGLDPASLGVPVVVVEDTLQALQTLAKASLKRHTTRVAAITGSNGKTTTKDLTLAALATLGRVHATRGNRNNHVGVPLTVLERDGDEPYLVAELGANDFGEIETLSKLIEPEAAIITNIGRAHLERFGSIQGVLRAKSEIFTGLRPGGLALLNADDVHFEALQRKVLSGDVRSYGFAKNADVRIETLQETPEGIQTILLAATQVSLARPGRANARNAAAAFALATHWGARPEDVAARLSAATFTGQRSCWLHWGDLWVLDDSYNANPDSMLEALQWLVAREGRKIAVLGSMLELGSESRSLHAQLGRAVAESGVDLFYGFGEEMREAVEAAHQQGMKGVFHSSDMQALVQELSQAVRPGDVLLVKGSRGCRMERVVEALRVVV